MSGKHFINRISEKRKHIATGLIELGNLSLAALFFGQAYGGMSFKLNYALVGILGFSISYLLATMILKEPHDH